MLSLPEVVKRLSLRVTNGQLAALDSYAIAVLEANLRAGLTSSSTSLEAIYERHFAESLGLLAALDALELTDSPVIDVGTGAGFPGLVIKIVRPKIEMTLLEATGKKADFLRQTVEVLGLTAASVVQARAEEAGREREHRERYPLVLARAVAPLRVLLEYTLPFLRAGGVLAAPKGSAAPREIREAAHALEVLGGEIERTEPLDVPGAEGPQPTLVIVRKVAGTPAQYPRRPGMPAKRPL